MRPRYAFLDDEARPPGDGAGEGRSPVGLDLREQPGERLRFERLLAELSATFVNVAADQVDSQIEQALEQLVDALGVERSGFAQVSEDEKGILVTHSFVLPGYPP